MRERLVFYGVRILLVAIPLVILGSCAKITVGCWARGGTVLKNVFDWPTCVEVRPK